MSDLKIRTQHDGLIESQYSVSLFNLSQEVDTKQYKMHIRFEGCMRNIRGVSCLTCKTNELTGFIYYV